MRYLPPSQYTLDTIEFSLYLYFKHAAALNTKLTLSCCKRVVCISVYVSKYIEKAGGSAKSHQRQERRGVGRFFVVTKVADTSINNERNKKVIEVVAQHMIYEQFFVETSKI